MLYVIRMLFASPICMFYMYLVSQGEFLKLAVPFSGLLVGRGKKVKFRGIFNDKFAEKMADFAGISQEFARPVSLKNDW